MATYTFSGISVTYHPVTEDPVDVQAATLTLVIDDTNAGLSYTLLNSPPNDLPEVELNMPGNYSALINGQPFTDNPLDEDFFGQANWGSGNVTIIYSHYDDDTGLDNIFWVSGAAIPLLTTAAQFENFVSQITYLGAVQSGPFIPGAAFQFSDLTGASVSQNDNITGDAGDNVLRGGIGNDVINGGDGNDSLAGGDGADTVEGGNGDDTLIGGDTENDLADQLFGGAGNDSIDGGHGNDRVSGGSGNDTVEGGFGVDTIIGNGGDDVLTGSAWSDLIFGGPGDDFINGGFGSDRVNGGAGADRFFHVGVEGHGSDWIQDYTAADGDILRYGGASRSLDDFQVNFANTAGAGSAAVAEAFVIYRPSGQILWALIDGAGQDEINIQLGGTVYDLMA